MAEEELNESLEYTPTWIVAVVCTIIVFISLVVERGLHKLGKYFKKKNQTPLFDALQKLQEELMLLGFISLLLTVFQTAISHICISPELTTTMLPCKRPHESSEGSAHDQIYYDGIINKRRLFSVEDSSQHCRSKGKVPLLSQESLHHLHIFIFVLALVHAIFCVTTLFLGITRMRQWKRWEEEIKSKITRTGDSSSIQALHHHEFFKKHADGYWRRAAVVGWLISFFKQFYGSVTESDYIALRYGFIKEHCPRKPQFDFHNYMVRTLEVDFRRIVGISWYLWLFVVLFLLLNIAGWHTYFWLAFLPVIILLLVGAKLEHIIARLAQEPAQESARVKPSDEYFWFSRPTLILDLLHFTLFQNSFEIAFFFWIWCTYGFDSCIMEKISYIIPRLIMGVIVQVLCSYSTLPLYTLVTQMGSGFKKGMLDPRVEEALLNWAEERHENSGTSRWRSISSHRMTKEQTQNDEHEIAMEMEDATTSSIELPSSIVQIPLDRPISCSLRHAQ
ncbi:hypothetical protein HN51_065189 [Arachis hypogaea]|uniref:MLO-like protein 13 n=2 Tax=Arachis TaxID=3817 RepID=UPI0007AF028D|nr:MLO-like protein 13 isoform X1 [Arachis ipaensis]XP_025646152.1 MLO-like protein 13 [Arachis hypogaea]QHO06325.1 MLO-like protein [Arachis hypogaea]